MLLACMCQTAHAQERERTDDGLFDAGLSTPFIYADGVNRFGEIQDRFGHAFIDAAANQVSISTQSGSFGVSFAEIAEYASRGDPVRKEWINSELDYVFREGGVTLADGGMGLSSPKDSRSLTNYRDFCAALQCGDRMSGWLDGWHFEQKPPSRPPKERPKPPPVDECAEAFAEVVDARLALDAAENTCKRATTRGGHLACATMTVYAGVRTALASRRAAECAVPPPPESTPPKGPEYWGWSF
ncbi:hypothetical protein [Vulcaniibacterium gelatinicum]|uniref:hypothetical protein n=1 Tax=Vulcaniibacterium gelatinicum TaxID=2598725 RepID=UPI0011C8C7C1|nr:hypothetical protein [Vulcaniibacterium gelatinicum]